MPGGARKTITLFAFFGALGAVLFGLSPCVEMATVARVMVGFGLSAIFVPALRICAEWFRPREYAGISGLLLAMGGVGWFVAATPLAWLTATFGWRGTFIGIGCITAVLSVLTWFLWRTHRRTGALHRYWRTGRALPAQNRPRCWTACCAC